VRELEAPYRLFQVGCQLLKTWNPSRRRQLWGTVAVAARDWSSVKRVCVQSYLSDEELGNRSSCASGASEVDVCSALETNRDASSRVCEEEEPRGLIGLLPACVRREECNAMQCNAMQCNAMQCNAMRYAMHIFKSSSFFTFFDRQRAKAAMTLSAQVRLKRVQELEAKIELRHCDLGSSRLAPFFPGSRSVCVAHLAHAIAGIRECMSRSD